MTDETKGLFKPRADWMHRSDWTDNELRSMVVMIGTGLHPEPFEQADLDRFEDWASETRLNLTLIQNVLEGLMSVVWRENEWRFALTDKGIEIAEQLKAGASA